MWRQGHLFNMHTNKPTFFARLARLAKAMMSAAFMLLILSACTSFEYHETKVVDIEKIDEAAEALINEDELLDVGIVLIDPGVDVLDDESAAYSNVRQSESVWYTSQLKDTLEQSNAWGIVRAVPSGDPIMDVVVNGKLLESNGEVVSLQVTVRDSSGLEWFSKEYFQRASAYAYHPEVKVEQDPFQAMFNEVANDLFDYQAALTSEQRLNVRAITKVRFARDFVPEAFTDFVVENNSGILELQRIPASNDPMIQRIDAIQARNDLFLDVVQNYYRGFNKSMSVPYQEWRRLSYKEVVYERQLREQARNERLAGIAVIAGGLLAAGSNSRTTRTAGQVGIFGGAALFRRGFLKTDEALLHSETLRELGSSLEAELEPSVVDLQDRSITLSGTVDDQFKEWRRILTRMFEVEQGGDIDQVIFEQPAEPATETLSTSVEQ